jgi:hypothetical protein
MLMNARELMPRAVESVVAVLDADDLTAPTPCTDFDVRGLINHFAGTTHWLAQVGKRAPTDPDDPYGTKQDVTTGDWRALLRDRVHSSSSTTRSARPCTAASPGPPRWAGGWAPTDPRCRCQRTRRRSTARPASPAATRCGSPDLHGVYWPSATMDGGRMQVVGEISLDFSSYRRLVLSVFGAKYWIIQALMALAIVSAVVQLALRGPSFVSLTMLLACTFGLAIFEIAVLIGWRRTAKLTTQPWRYVVTESDVTIQTPHTNVTTRWDGVAGVRTRRHVWAIKLANKVLVPIPRAAFTPDDAAQIDTKVAALGTGSR